MIVAPDLKSSGKILFPDGRGLIPAVVSYLHWDGDKWCDSLSSARVDLALNGYLDKSGEGKQEGCVLHFLTEGP